MPQNQGTARTWHHGLVARWWAEFNHGGDDVEVFRQIIERSGAPVLDAGDEELRDVARADVLALCAVEHVRLREAGTERGHRDARSAKLLRERLGQREDEGLARSVGGE